MTDNNTGLNSSQEIGNFNRFPRVNPQFTPHGAVAEVGAQSTLEAGHSIQQGRDERPLSGRCARVSSWLEKDILVQQGRVASPCQSVTNRPSVIPLARASHEPSLASHSSAVDAGLHRIGVHADAMLACRSASTALCVSRIRGRFFGSADTPIGASPASLLESASS